MPHDNTTLFVCSGMQNLKEKFSFPDNSKYSNLQSCIRTNDLDLIGDSAHLTSFEMLGCFGFGTNDYKECCKMWHLIVKELNIPITHVNVHPDSDHYDIWHDLGYKILVTEDCKWSDGNIGGYCCELFKDDLEIGNLVNPLGHSIDVGFGLERMVQIIENKDRVDDTSLFNQSYNSINRDLSRTLNLLYSQNIKPGSKGRNNIARILARKWIGECNEIFKEWIIKERKIMSDNKKKLELFKNDFMNKPFEYWYNTHGLTQQEIEDYLK